MSIDPNRNASMTCLQGQNDKFEIKTSRKWFNDCEKYFIK